MRSGNARKRAAGPRFERHRRRVSELLRAAIAGRRDAPDLERRTDVLSILIAAGRDDEAKAITDDELHDELITLLVAATRRPRARSAGLCS